MKVPTLRSLWNNEMIYILFWTYTSPNYLLGSGMTADEIKNTIIILNFGVIETTIHYRFE